jgi:hypothetical protein
MKEIPRDEIVNLKEGGDLVVHTKDSTIYFFEKSYYQISNDSILGKGHAKFSNASDFRVFNEGVVALKNIETIQQDELNQYKTWLLMGGILVVVIASILILFPSTNSSEIIVSPTN